MGYSNQIEILKNRLNSYSAEEEKLSELYKKAILNAENAHAQAKKQKDEQYYADRNAVYADNARDERNFNNTLAARGLGFSGEAAQASLNSNINLSNRLGELKREKDQYDTDLDLKLASDKAELYMDESEKLKDMLKNKDAITADIAKMELDKENAEARLRAEKEMQDAELKAERDMLEAELQAKYYAGGNSGSGSGSGGGGGNGSQTLEGEMTEDGYVPDIAPKELASRLVSSTGSKNISKEEHEYMLNKFLLEVQKNYDINEEYYNELLFTLKAYGYKEISQPEMRVQVVGYESKLRFDEKYKEIYDKFIVKGVSDATVHAHATETAMQEQMEYIYGNVNNNTEFKMCCRKYDIPEDEITEFLNLKNVTENRLVTSRNNNGYPTRAPQ